MLCESIRPRIRTFLDDLLDEKDYQDIQAHLGGCERCRAYASSVGTLSYRLYELGQAPVPPDMSSAILYGLEKQRQAAFAVPVASLPEENGTKDMTVIVTRLFWAVIFLALAVTAVVITMIAGRVRSTPTPLAVTPSETVAQVSAPDEETLE